MHPGWRITGGGRGYMETREATILKRIFENQRGYFAWGADGMTMRAPAGLLSTRPWGEPSPREERVGTTGLCSRFNLPPGGRKGTGWLPGTRRSRDCSAGARQGTVVSRGGSHKNLAAGAIMIVERRR